tara:strand:- start:166 stop:549 length:384 start_codon:yes stop_codon:yes gene_type:complete
MKIFEITETRITTKPVMHKGRKVYKHDFSDKLFASEQDARNDEYGYTLKSQSLKKFGGKSSDVQDFKEVTPEELKKRLGDILGALGASGALQNLEKNFNKMLQQFKGDIEVMDKILQKKEDELGLSI